MSPRLALREQLPEQSSSFPTPQKWAFEARGRKMWALSVHRWLIHSCHWKATVLGKSARADDLRPDGNDAGGPPPCGGINLYSAGFSSSGSAGNPRIQR